MEKGFTPEELVERHETNIPLIEEEPNNVGLKECAVERNAFPPYDVYDWNGNLTCLKLAVPGYSDQDIAVELEGTSLIITATEVPDGSTAVTHKGIYSYAFAKVFTVNEGTVLLGYDLYQGLLFVSLAPGSSK